MKRSTAALMFAAAALAGCSTVEPDPFLTASVSRPDAPPIASEVSPSYAVALLPMTAGRVRTVRQTARRDYLQQQVVYENPTHAFGENSISVELGQPDLDAAMMKPPSRARIASEMRQALPGVAMTIRPAVGENQQGPFGYATGSFGSSGSCIYGWQYVNPNAKRNPLAAMASSVRQYRMQVRLRYCHPTIPEDRIGSLMEGLRIKPVSSETLSMLEFAAGSGESAIAVPVAEEPEASVEKPVQRRRAVRKAETFDASELDSVVLPIVRRQPPAGAAVIYANGQPMPNAARVPMPVQGAASAVDPTTTAARTGAVTVPAAVPLPGTVTLPH